MLTNAHINKALQAVFPGMRDWLPTDTQYLPCNQEYLSLLVADHCDPENRYIPNLWECEEIAAAFVVDVRRTRRDQVEQIAPENRFNCAIGEAYADRLYGYPQPHVVNLAIDQNKRVLLCDLQTKRIWPADPAKDFVYFVRM